MSERRSRVSQQMHVRRPAPFFRRGKPDQEPEPENLTNLIEIMPMPMSIAFRRATSTLKIALLGSS